MNVRSLMHKKELPVKVSPSVFVICHFYCPSSSHKREVRPIVCVISNDETLYRRREILSNQNLQARFEVRMKMEELLLMAFIVTQLNLR